MSIAIGPVLVSADAARERSEVARPSDLLGRPAEQLVVRADRDGQRARLRALPAARRRRRRSAGGLPHRRHVPGRRCLSEPEEGLDRSCACTRTCCRTTGCWSRRSGYRRASTSRTRTADYQVEVYDASAGAARRTGAERPDRADPLGAGPPERLVATVRRAGEDEEQVGEPVQVDRHERVDLRPRARRPAPRARPGGRRRARRAGERRPRCRRAARSSSARAGASLCASQRRSSSSTCACVTRSRSSLSANGTERSAPRSKSSFWIRSSGSRSSSVEVRQREHETDLRVELVDHPVGGDARIELRGPRAVAEARLAPVAAARVDLGQADRLVALARAHPCASSRSRRPRIERAITSRWISLVPS